MYDWYDTIPDDGIEEVSYTLLPEGIYLGVAKEVKKSWSSGKGCPQSIITWHVRSKFGSSQITDWINLHENMLWKIKILFRAVGLRKKGEPINMGNFDLLQGKSCYLKVSQKPVTHITGTKVYNQIDSYVPEEEVPDTYRVERTNNDDLLPF